MTTYGKDYAACYNAHWQEWGAGELAPFIHDVSGVSQGTWLDVACGTGEVVVYAVEQGFDAAGIDLSAHQLKHAKAKVPTATFKKDDARSFDLQRQFDVVTCVGGSVGYCHTKRDLERVLRCLKKHTKPGGVMLFDMNLPGAFEENAGQTIALPDDDCPMMTTIRYNQRKRRGTLNITGFTRAGKWWRRFDETHELQAWLREDVEPILKRLSLDFRRHDVDALCPADDETVRMLYRCTRGT